MKRGHYVVIGGAALFVIGIAVVVAWALPIAGQIQKETAFLQREQLHAGESESLSLEVTDTSKPLSVFASSTDTTVPLAIVVTSPEGGILLQVDEDGGALALGVVQVLHAAQSVARIARFARFAHGPSP